MNFSDALYAAAQPRPIGTNPFLVAVARGEATREQIRSFAVHIASATESFVRALHSILGVCTDVRVRQSFIGNILEEEGATSYVLGQPVLFDPARNHPSLARRFALAAGATDVELRASQIGPPLWFIRALQKGNWLGPFAYVAVGTEANTPAIFRVLIPGLAHHYGFSEHELEYFTEHVTADDRHGIEGAELIAAIAVTDEARQQALEGARRGGRGWWEILCKHLDPVGSVPA